MKRAVLLLLIPAYAIASVVVGAVFGCVAGVDLFVRDWREARR